jgi:membrane-associated phospholipid phosphatase
MAVRDSASGRNEVRGNAVPALTARPGGLADRFAGRVGRQRPVTVFFAALISGFALLAVAAILLGLLVTDVLVPIHAVGSADEGFVESLVADRTPVLTDVSAVGTAAGGAPVLPILAGLIAIVCALMRRWLIAGFAVFVLAVESATYRVSSLVVPRERPSVHRLEDLPADASYPSGHTAASIAVYAGLVLLLTSKLTDRRARIAAWALAVLLPVLVAMSRMYRGMHHPLDVASGVVIGIGAITVLLFACRSAGCAQRSPAAERTPARAGRARTA